ncbi:MAG: addiction module protein [Spirochaetes bacterium]|nr:addiction module protein [Spirochaetota bacterium]
MNVNIPLDKMSISEKISAMESIWEDLVKNADSLSSPEWHKTILDHRSKSVAKATAGFSEWESAKQDIRKSAIRKQL